MQARGAAAWAGLPWASRVRGIHQQDASAALMESINSLPVFSESVLLYFWAMLWELRKQINIPHTDSIQFLLMRLITEGKKKRKKMLSFRKYG